jgi:hypothetical protein
VHIQNAITDQYMINCWRQGGDADPYIVLSNAFDDPETQPLNFTNYYNEQVGEVLETLRTTDDLDERKAALEELGLLFAEDVPNTWTGGNNEFIATKPAVNGVDTWTLPDGAPVGAGQERHHHVGPGLGGGVGPRSPRPPRGAAATRLRPFCAASPASRHRNAHDRSHDKEGRMALEIDLGPEAAAFRDELREWLASNHPESSRASRSRRRGAARPGGVDRGAGCAGYLCVSWPKEYGGRGLTGVEVAVMNEEFARAGVPRVTRGMGEWLVGPSIIVHGTDEQKRRFLPRIISGEDVYCQGFSEPDAGSDLAGLKTRGVVDGDEVVITGQKVWTSGRRPRR